MLDEEGVKVEIEIQGKNDGGAEAKEGEPQKRVMKKKLETNNPKRYEE